jgi:cobalt/nickel transport system ATP-binding protein
MASVVVTNPVVLLLDVPTAGLDPRTRRWLVELVDELGRAGKTIVVATHDLDALGTVADRCLVLSEDHRVVAEGSPGEVLARPDLLVEVNLLADDRPVGGPGAR